MGHDMGGSSGLAWDWALDFRNVLVVVGPSQRPNTRNPRHFQRGHYDGKQMGIEDLQGESVICRAIEDPSKTVEIPAEYLLPVRPDREGQMSIVIAGDQSLKGQQRHTAYKNDTSWMMEQDQGDVVALVLDEDCLARIWKE